MLSTVGLYLYYYHYGPCKYLGSTIDRRGGVSKDDESRVAKARSKWRGLTAVICDKNVLTEIKPLYETVIRPTAAKHGQCKLKTKSVAAADTILCSGQWGACWNTGEMRRSWMKHGWNR